MPVRSGLMGVGAQGTTPLGFGASTAPTPVSAPVSGPLPLAVPPIPHLAVPFTIGPTGSAQTVQQGTLDEVTQCVANLAGTRPGTRLMVPKFGSPDPTFGGLDPVTFQLAVRQWEPRATVAIETVPGESEQVNVLVGLAGGAA